MTNDADEREAGDTGGDGPDPASVDGMDSGDAETESNASDPTDPTDEEQPPVDDGLLERVASADPETLAREITALQTRADEAETALAERQDRIDDLESKLKRERADFQNYKKRMEDRREQLRQRANEDLIERFLEVRDNLARALDQDEDVDVREGVETTLRQFDRILAEEDVDRIEPEPGQSVDPTRHEVLTTVSAAEPEGVIVDLYRPGYEMDGTIIRPAQVTVSEGQLDEDGEEAQAEASTGTDENRDG